MNGTDGEVIIPLGFDTSDAIEDAEQLAKQVDDILKDDSGASNSKITKLDQDMKRSVETATELTSKMQELADTQIPTEEYSKAQNELAKLDKEFDKLLTRQESLSDVRDKWEELQEKMNENRAALQRVVEGSEKLKQAYPDKIMQITMETTAATEKLDKEYQSLSAQAEKFSTKMSQWTSVEEKLDSVSNKIYDVKNRMKEMEETQNAFKDPKMTPEYNKLENKLVQCNDKLKVQLIRHKENTEEIKKQPAIVEKLRNAFKSIATVLVTVKTGVSKLIISIGKMAGKVKEAVSNWVKHRAEINRNNNSIGGLVKNFLKYALGIGSLIMLFNRLRAAISEGLNNLILFNNGMNDTNAAVSKLQSSVLYLKNSLATLAAPVIQFVAPAIAAVMDRLAAMAKQVAAIIASLTGKSTITVAKKTSVNAAANSTGGSKAQDAATKANEKYQAAKKKAEEKYAKQMSAVQEKRAKAQAKAEERQAKAAKKYAEAQEKANSALGNYDKLNVIATESSNEFEDALDDMAEFEDPVMEEINPDDYLDGLSGLGDGVADMFEEVPIDSILDDTINDWIDKFKEAIKSGDWESVGAMIAQSLNTALEVVDNWINNVKSKAIEWASNIARILNGLVEAFDWELLGKTIADGINLIIETLNSFLEKFDFENFGSKVGEALKSLFDNVNWDELGEFFANKWNALIDFIYGLVNTEGLWESIGGSIAEFINNWFENVDWDKLSETVSTGINGIITAAQTAIENIKWEEIGAALGESFKKLLDNIKWEEMGTTIGNGINGLIASIKTFVETPGVWESAGKAVADGITGLFTSIDWTQVTETLTTSLNGIVTSLDTIIKNLDWAAAGEEFSTQIHNLITGIDWAKVGETLSDLFIGLLDFLNSMDMSQAIEDLYNAFVELVEGIDWLELGAKLLELIGNLILTGVQLKQSVKDSSKKLLGDALFAIAEECCPNFGEGLKEGFSSIEEWIRTNLYEPLMQAIEKLWGISGIESGDSTSTIFKKFGIALIKSLLAGIKETWTEKIKPFFDEKIQALKDSIQQKFEKFKENGKALINKLKSGVSERWSDFKNNIIEKFNVLKDTLKQKAEKFISIGRDIVNGLKEGIKEKWDDLTSWVRGKFDGLRESARSVLEINSPSKVFAEIGGSITEGLAVGIEDGYSQAESAVEDVAGNLVDVMNDTSDEFLFSPVDNAVIDSLGDMLDKLEKISNVFTSISNVLDGISGKQLTVPDIAVGKVIPTSMAMSNAGGGNEAGNGDIKRLLRELLETMEDNSTNLPPVELTLDKKVVARAVFDEQEKRYKQLGQYVPSFV